MNATTKKSILELKDNTDALAQMVQEVNSWDGSLDSYEVHDFDEEFFSTYFEGKPEEAARATFFGEIQNWMDEYIRFNGYGNLESLSSYQRDKELIEGAEEITERFIELAETGNVDSDYILEQHT